MSPEPLTFPPDSVQAGLGSPWWQETGSAGQPTRGRLIWAFCPIVSLKPKTLQPTSRAEATKHESALFELRPLHVRQNASAPKIPVAAIPSYPGEVLAVYRAKRRPMLVLSTGGPPVSAEDLKAQGKGWQTQGMVIAAPYFGVDQNGLRGGWNPEFVRRIRHAEYPQYMCDRLPVGGAEESILRLDQAQPIGRHQDSYELTKWELSPDALEVVDEWLGWLLTETLDPEGLLTMFRQRLTKIPVP